MAEYGVGLRELDQDWTPGITFLMLRRITERYKGRAGKKNEKTVTEDDLIHSELMKG